MSELKKIAADIESVFAGSSYPPGFLSAYDQMECLASHSGRETFLVRRKSDGLQAVAKCYDQKVFPVRIDISQLQNISCEGIPRYYEQFQNDNTLCIIREYIEGTPLNIYAKDKNLSRQEILGIANSLCDILNVLHCQTPPIIHRDIKPENIIVHPDGKISLIDFDISRIVRQEAETDSVILGTKGYAPPEQYGFEQTDQRSDIYAFGVLLRWLVTGNIRANKNIRMDPVFQEVIDRCTAFSPNDRYSSILQVKKALAADKDRSSRLSRRSVLMLAVSGLFFLLAGFGIGYFTGFFRAPEQVNEPVVFTEPLIEAAVRLQLGADKDTALYSDDLSAVKNIYIFGNQAYADNESFSSLDIAQSIRGSVHTLSDLLLLPELESFHIAYQGKIDISAMSQMKNLDQIEIKHAELEDIYPIGDIRMLHSAFLFSVGISDATALENCHWLDALDIGFNEISSMDKIGRYPFLKSLCLRGLRMDTLDGIEEMTELREVTISKAEIKDITALTKLPRLEKLFITAEQEEAARIFENTSVEIIILDN